MDDTSRNTIAKLQKQIAEMVIRLQAISANLSKLAGNKDENRYQQFITLQKEARECTGSDSISETSVVCLECGRVCRVLTRKHLALHGLTPDMYRLKWGIGRDTPLMCAELLQSRKNRMNDMKLWERSRNQGRKGRRTR